MQVPDESNIIFQTAANFINNTNHPVFLTGKAGTGKTTFLKYIRENTHKNAAIVAPTGVAAINAGGTTIHSFFQLPFMPFLPGNRKNFYQQDVSDKHSLIAKLKLSSERKELMQQLELLIIDEVSMVRCDVIDAIDTVLRSVRNRHSVVFGGVQILYIGDMYQLPPVVKEEEMRILETSYANQFFFSSQAVIEQPPVQIELKKVYRQSDPVFIDLLNQVRNNEMTESGYELLHSRFKDNFEQGSRDNYITLTSHNRIADEINREALAKLGGEVYSFKAGIEGSFNENAFPTDEILNLKTGAQVMFIKNDTEKTRRYYNGKIGVVKKIDDDKIWIECAEGNETGFVEVKIETWQNIQYSLNKATQQIEEKEIGSFKQYPLRLAWAITIHKSQGLTFEKAVIDAGNAFAPGQVYVALSRCTSLEGIVLQSRIPVSSFRCEERIVAFSNKQPGEEEQQAILVNTSILFQQEIILSLFDFNEINSQIRELSEWIKQQGIFTIAVTEWLQSVALEVGICVRHAKNFTRELETRFAEKLQPEKNVPLQQRLMKASEWFYNEACKIKATLRRSTASTDNRQLAKDFDRQFSKILDNLCLKIHLLDKVRNGFQLNSYYQNKKEFKKESFNITAYSGISVHVPVDVRNQDLYRLLKEKRNELSIEKGVAIYMVCSTQSLEEMSEFLPQDMIALEKIKGFGKTRVKQFGPEFIGIIQDYCAMHELQSPGIPDHGKKRRPERNVSTRSKEKPDTKKRTFELFRSGLTIPTIAAERNLASSTIEGHLAFFIESGELAIDDIVDKKIQVMVKEEISKGLESLQALKVQLPGLSYGEIKWVIAAEKYRALEESPSKVIL